MFRVFGLVLFSVDAALPGPPNSQPPTVRWPNYNCLPGDSCWPFISEWRAFNQTLSGKLVETVMLESPCFPTSPDYNNATCMNIKENLTNGDFRAQAYGSMAYNEWETCGSANCLPSELAPQSKECSLGRMSAYHVRAESAEDVQATLKFVKDHNIRLIIKNTGHDFLGRSSAPNTLALWTANMKTLEYHPSFQANTCSLADHSNVGVMGAGILAHEAVDFFLQYDMDVTVGACPTVGIAGGFGQSGGHGAFAPSYGLMVDQAIEYDVVTADGVLRTINECNSPDLFWAMRGGGGGTYAVLLNYKFKLHPKKAMAMYTFWANISDAAVPSNTTKSQILNDTLTLLAKSQLTWSNNEMAGYDFLYYNSIETHQILPANGDVLGRLKDLTSEWRAFVSGNPAFEEIQNNFTLFNNQSAYEAGTADIIARNNRVGVGALPASRLVPRSQFENAKSIDVLVGGMLKGMDNARQLNSSDDRVAFGIYKVTPANTPDIEEATSVNPAWRTSLWHVIVDGGWEQGFPQEDIEEIQKYVREGLQGLAEVLPTQACYTNEADFMEENWQSVFYGKHYQRLLGIKKRYDPTSLFNCWKCVGWLGEEDQMYSCYGDDPMPSSPA